MRTRQQHALLDTEYGKYSDRFGIPRTFAAPLMTLSTPPPTIVPAATPTLAPAMAAFFELRLFDVFDVVLETASDVFFEAFDTASPPTSAADDATLLDVFAI